jgi:hypothetical protein
MNIILRIFKATFILKESNSKKSQNSRRKKMEKNNIFGVKSRKRMRFKDLNFKNHRNSCPSYNLQENS